MRHLLVLVVSMLLVSIGGAQTPVTLRINVDRQPIWGPTGYDYVEYYYLPDIETYYYVPERRFFYYEGGRWVGVSSLPSRYHGYDLYNSYKVVVNDPTPYQNHKTYKAKYVSYKGRLSQKAIRDSRDSKYFVNDNHPEHGNWKKQQSYDNGKGKGKSGK